MSQFLESICAVNGKILNLNYHQERVNRTFKEFYKNSNTLNLEKVFKDFKVPNEKTKIRVVYSDNYHTFTFDKYKEREIKKVKVVRDDNIDYSYKSANRDKINKHLANNKDFDDIIILKNNLVTDTSYSNLLFFDGNNWVTPKTPLLKGTKRENLLNKKVIKEKNIAKEDINSYLFFMTINAMLDFDEKRKMSISKIVF